MGYHWLAQLSIAFVMDIYIILYGLFLGFFRKRATAAQAFPIVFLPSIAFCVVCYREF